LDVVNCHFQQHAKPLKHPWPGIQRIHLCVFKGHTFSYYNDHLGKKVNWYLLLARDLVQNGWNNWPEGVLPASVRVVKADLTLPPPGTLQFLEVYREGYDLLPEERRVTFQQVFSLWLLADVMGILRCFLPWRKYKENPSPPQVLVIETIGSLPQSQVRALVCYGGIMRGLRVVVYTTLSFPISWSRCCLNDGS
jgi:hypothetical protein